MTGARVLYLAVTPITLYSSWRGMGLAILSPALLVAIGAYGLILGGRWLWLPGVIFAAGLVLATISLFDFPVKVIFTGGGVERRMALRHQVIPWDNIMVLERFRKRHWRVPRWMRVGEDRDPSPPTPGGLVALTGSRRRYLLVDRGESQPEYDSLVSAMTEWAPDVVVNAARPDKKVPPTFLYRRRS